MDLSSAPPGQPEIAPPQFGEPLPVQGCAETLALLARRRSSSATSLRAPGPSAAELDQLLRLATRVPDHGKLSPWRFIVIEGEAKTAYVEGLRRIAAGQDKLEQALAKPSAPPVTVAVVSRPTPGKIPVWEQELSAGAVCMALLVAAQAMGYGANWITDWYAFDPQALAWLGVGEGEKLAAFIHLGTPAEPPLERVRPEIEALTTRWSAPG